MNNSTMSKRKSSHKVEVGKHDKSYCTDSKASMARTRSVLSIGVSGGEISSGVGGTITGVNGDRMSSRNGGTHASSYASQRAIQTS